MAIDDPHGWLAFRDLYDSGRWEPETHAAIRRFLRPGRLFVDVGAWIGPTTLWALQEGADVIAVEPDPVALPELRQAVAGRAVELWECAVAAEPGMGLLAPNPKPGGQFGDSMSRLSTDTGGIAVTVMTLQQIIGTRHPALVKVDIEGGELDLIPAVAPWLASIGAALHVSYHGVLPDRSLYNDFTDVHWPSDPWGDVVANV